MTNKRIQLSTNVDGQNVNVYPVTKSEFVEFSDGKTLNDKLNNMDGNHEHGLATPAKDGFMSKEDKAKLDGVNNYTHPSTHAATMITEDSTHRFVTDAEKTKWDNKADNVMASKTNAGLMSASDKQRIDGLNAEFKTRDDKITKNTEDIKSWNDEMINKEYQYFNGKDITIENSIVSKTTDMIIKGKTLNNLFKVNAVKDDSTRNFLNATTPAVNEPKDRIVYVVNNSNKKIVLNVFKMTNEWDSNPIIMENSITKLDLTSKRLIGILGKFEHGWTNNETDKEELKNTCIVLDREEDFIPQKYFEGIKSFGQQENKINVLSANAIKITGKYINYANDNLQGDSYQSYVIKCNDAKKIAINLKDKDIIRFGVECWKSSDFNNNKNFIGNLNYFDNKFTKQIFTPLEGTKYIKIYLSNNMAIATKKLAIEVFANSFPNEDYKEDKKDILLQDLGFNEGLKDLTPTIYDEINNIKNIAIKRIDKKVLNGNEPWIMWINSTGDVMNCYLYFDRMSPNLTSIVKPNSKCLNDKFPSNKGGHLSTEEGFVIASTYFALSINKNRLGIQDVNDTNNLPILKKWLNDNPITVYFELKDYIERPLVDNIELKTFKEKTYITSNDMIKGELNLITPMNTAANLENNSNRLNAVEGYIYDNKNNIDKISKLEEGAVTSSLNIIDLQKEIKNDNNYIHYEGSNIGINNLSKDSRTSNMIIEGKTYQNLAENVLIERTSRDEGIVYTNIPVLAKNNTEYTLILDVIKNTTTKNSNDWGIYLDAAATNNSIVSGSTPTGLRKSGFIGRHVFKFTSRETGEIKNMGIGMHVDYGSSYEFQAKAILLEGDWTNKKLPLNYFEGIQSVGESEENKIKIISHGKNLLNPDLIKANPENVSNFKNTNGIISGSIDTQYKGTIEVPIGVKEKTKVFIKGLFKACRLIIGNCWLDDGSYRSIIDTNNWGNNLNSFEIGNRIVYIDSNSTMRIENPRNASVDFIAKDLCCYVIDGSENDPYEPYKEDTTTIQLKAPLRENDYLYEDNNQVKVYREKNKYVITGDENWTGFKVEESGLARMILDIPDIKSDSKLISNIPVVDFSGSWANRFECITKLSSTKSILVYLKNCSDTTAFKNKLKQLKLNNSAIELIYELNIPIIEKIENCLDLNLEVFKNKTYISSNNVIQGEINFNIANNLKAQVKENTSFINKASKAINQINNKNSKIEAAQLSTALNVLDLNNNMNMILNHNLSEYETYKNVRLTTINNTISGFSNNSIIKGQTLQNLLVDSERRCRINKEINRDSRIFLFDTTCVLDKDKEYMLCLKILKNSKSGYTGLRIYGLKEDTVAGGYQTIANDGIGGDVVFNWTLTRLKEQEGINRIGIYVEGPDFDNGADIIFEKVMLFEKDQNFIIPNDFIEGIKSSGEQENNTIRFISCEKNILDTNDFYNTLKNINSSKIFKEVKDEKYCIKMTQLSEYWEKGYERIKFKKNTQYVFSGEAYHVSNNRSILTVKYTDGTFNDISIDPNGWNNFLLTTPPNKTVKGIYSAYTTDTYVYINIENFMIREGTSTEFKPYIGENIKIKTKTPLMGINNYKDKLLYLTNDLYHLKNIKKYIFTGEEDWRMYSEKEGYDVVGFFLNFEDIGGNDSRVICNKFQSNDTDVFPGSLTVNKEIIVSAGSLVKGTRYIKIAIEKSKLKNNVSVDGFKQWLKANQTYIYYQSVTPELEKINNYNIDLKTYNDSTYIYTDNSVQSSIDIKVPKNVGAIINSLSNSISKIFKTLNNILNIKGE